MRLRMCDEVNRAEKAELQAAAREDAATATPQVAAAATAATHKAATHKDAAHKDADSKKAQVVDPEFARAENEDDDGYDPYSDRRPASEPLFERDPWS
jgi:hypothetical protein